MTALERCALTSLFVAAFTAALVAPERVAAADTAQKRFATPEAAVEALVAAAKANDRAALLALFGSESQEIVESGDPVADREGVERFVERYTVKHRIVKVGDLLAVLEIGDDYWPFPIPIVKDSAGWRLDGEAGEDEIVSRRIGRNELAAIQACLAYVDAQREYYARDPETGGLLHYARRFASTPGKRDGLYWPSAEGEEPSPLGPAFDEANEAGYALGKSSEPAPFHGYYFRILEGQGAKAPGGAYSYVVGDKLVGGFGLVAYPAVYGASGVMTFLVSHDGVVYQKDLGPETVARAKAIRVFDLDADMAPVPDTDKAEIEIGAVPAK